MEKYILIMKINLSNNNKVKDHINKLMIYYLTSRRIVVKNK